MTTTEDIFAIFGLDDMPFEKAIEKMPVSDIQALNEKNFTGGEHFRHFVQLMKLVITYENKIQDCLVNINILLLEYKNKNIGDIRSKDTHIIRGFMIMHEGYKFKLAKARQVLFTNPAPVELQIPESEAEDMTSMKADVVLSQRFPITVRLLNNSHNQTTVARAMAEIDELIHKSKDRISRTRRSEFRKAMVQNTATELEQFIHKCDESPSMFALHDTKLDRIVVDIYSKDLLTHDPIVKSHIEEANRQLSLEYSIKDIPTVEYLEALKRVTESEREDIDALVRMVEDERADKLRRGYVQKGKVIIDTDFGKAIFTYKPEINGAPIRLRVITNIQEMVRKGLFKDPAIKDYYEKHTWLGGSELNFIMPEHYQTYLAQESTICSLIETQSKQLFRDLVNEHLRLDCLESNILAYVSQFEICYEIPFRKMDIKSVRFIWSQLKGNRALTQHMISLWLRYHRFSGTYANLKWEQETRRPMFYCDVPSMDPTLPIMQYKVYPKFRDEKIHIMLRHEFIPTRFAKYFTLQGSDLPLSMLLLSQPAFVRETVERLFQHEFIVKGPNLQGYNPRYREVPEDETVVFSHGLMSKLLFGKRSDEFAPLFQSMLDTGLSPKTLPWSLRKKFIEHGMLVKVKHGRYELTAPFKAMMERLG